MTVAALVYFALGARMESATVLDSAAVQPTMPTWTLPGGIVYPQMALNTASLNAADAEATVKLAVSSGISNIDFHIAPGEVQGVAAALHDLGRDKLFLVSKLDKPPPNMTDPQAAAKLAQETIDKEFADLGVDHIDVFLLKDSATCAVMQAQWAVLEAELAKGRFRALGTYNYCPAAIECLLSTATTPPALNYIMRHPGMGPDASGLIGYGLSRGIRAVAYGTLGEPVPLSGLLSSPVLQQVAAAHGRTVEEVALRWNVQAGLAVSSRPNAAYNLTASHCAAACHVGISAMASAYGWSLSAVEVAAIDAMRLDTQPDAPAQPPTYYASAGCPHFNMSEAKTMSSPCAASAAASTWC